MTPRLDGIVETSLYVDDLDRSARFYQTMLGFEIIESSDRLVAMGVAGRQVLLLFKKGASANLPSTPHDGAGQLHVAFAVPANQIDTWDAWLGQQGVSIEERTAWARGGRSLYFRDPDRHVVELATPGVWSVY